MGALGARIGPRIPLTVGPLVCAAGTLLLARIGADASYWVDVLPPVVIFGFGLTVLVAPLTTTVLAAAEDRHAGVASGVNNAVARAAGLLAVAALPLVVGITTSVYADPPAFAAAFSRAMVVCAGLLALGGVIGWVFVRADAGRVPPTAVRTGSEGEDGTAVPPAPEPRDPQAPPLQPHPRRGGVVEAPPGRGESPALPRTEDL
jgi:MFS family permease